MKILIVPSEANEQEKYGYQYDRSVWITDKSQILVDRIEWVHNRYDERFGVDVYLGMRDHPIHVLMTREDFCKEAGIEIIDLTSKYALR